MRTRRLALWLALVVVLTACGSEPELGGVISPAAQPPPPARPEPSDPSTSEPEPTSQKPAPTEKRPVIVIDPGHSGRSIRSTEPTSGLTDFDYPNDPELYEVWQVSRCVAQGLRQLDYKVIMTKDSASDSVGLVERAEIANNADADLAISVHNDHSQGPDFQAVYSQRGVKHGGAYGPMWRGAGDQRTVFEHREVARASARYARAIAAERSGAQDRTVTVSEFDFSGREGLEPGNLPLVMLFAEVPWVYNEVGAMTGGSTSKRMPRTARVAYAQGLLNGIVAAVPPPAEAQTPTLKCR